MPECIFSQKFHLHFTQILQLIGRLPFFFQFKTITAATMDYPWTMCPRFRYLPKRFLNVFRKSFYVFAAPSVKGEHRFIFCLHGMGMLRWM